MKTSHLILAALAIAGGIYLYRRNNEETSAETETQSDFLGIYRSGTQRWADKKASNWCKLINARRVKDANAQLLQLVTYGYKVANCRAVKITSLSEQRAMLIEASRVLGKAKTGPDWQGDCYCNGGWGKDCCKSR